MAEKTWYSAATWDETSYPVTPLPENNGAAQWTAIPKILGFRQMYTNDFLTTGQLAAQIAYRSGMLYVRTQCETKQKQLPPMLDKYVSWSCDNGAEIFLQQGKILRQFVVNARGAILFWHNKKRQAPPEGVTLEGRREKGCWFLVLGVPMTKRQLAHCAINIRINSVGTFTEYCEMDSCAAVKTGHKAARDPVGQVLKTGDKQMVFTPLQLVTAIPKPELRRVEQTFNRAFYAMLEHYSTSLLLKELQRCEKRCGWNLTPLHQLDSQLHDPKLSLATKARLFGELCHEFAQFQAHFMLHGDHEPKLVAGPLTVDFSRAAGQIRHIHGTNLGPRLYAGDILTLNEPFKSLNFSYVRTHDAPLNNPAMRLVDTSLIFGNPAADPGDPQNYYFKATDDYLLNLTSLGCGIVYRLGVSIEHSVNKYAAHAPEDFDHFAEVCAGIVRHYNRGWGDGYNLNIKYFEVWNEPNLGVQMWDRGLDEYNRLYVTVAKRLKKEFPEIKVGGWSSCGFQQNDLINFLKKCAIEEAPLDFISWHRYGANAQDFVNDPFIARGWLDAFGFTSTETHLNEWHYFACDWSDFQHPARKKRLFKEHQGSNAAAFTVLVLSRWQSTPLDLAQYYATFLGSWSVQDVWGNFNKKFYALQAYGEIVRYVYRVVSTTNATDTSVLAGHDGQGNGAILIGAFKNSAPELKLRLQGVKSFAKLTVKAVDDQHDLTPIPVRISEGILTLPKVSASAIFLINFQYQ